MLLTKDSYPVSQKIFRDLLPTKDGRESQNPAPLEQVEPDSEMLRVRPHFQDKKVFPDTKEATSKAQFDNAQDLLDLMLIGKDHKGRTEIHLSLKDQIAEGLYIRLQKRDEGGYHALFVAPTYTLRNQLTPYVETLIKQLRQKGSKIVSHEIKVGNTIPDINSE